MIRPRSATPLTVCLLAATVLLAGDPPPAARLPAHRAAVRAAAWSPDGQVLATAGDDGVIRLWRRGDGSPVAELAPGAGKVLALAFTPDGRRLLTAGEDRNVRVWVVPGPPERLAGHSGRVRALVQGCDADTLISGGEDRAVIVWDRPGRKPRLRIEGLAAAPVALAASPDGVWLAGALADGTVRLWALTTPSPQPAPAPASGPAPAAEGAPVDLIRQGESWRYFKGTAAPPADWAKPGFDDSGWASGESGFGYSSTPAELATVKTRLDDMLNKYLTLFIRKSFEVQAGGAGSAGGTGGAGSTGASGLKSLALKVLYDDGFVAYLNGEEVGRKNVSGKPPRHDAKADSTIEPLEAVIDLTPHIARLVPGKNVVAIQGHNCSLLSSDFILTPVLSGTAAKLPPPPAPPPPEKAEKPAPAPPPPPPPPKPGDEVKKIEGFGAAVLSLDFSPDGKRLACGVASGAIAIHSVPDGAQAVRLEGHSGPARSAAFLADGLLASLCDAGVQIWKLDEKKAVQTLHANRGRLSAMAVRPDRRAVAGAGEDGAVHQWEAATGKELGLPAVVPDKPVSALAFSPDGKLLASGSSGGGLIALDLSSGKPAGRFSPGGEVLGAVVTPDGHLWTAGSGNDILDWRLGSPSAEFVLSNHSDLVRAVAVTADGKEAASAGADGAVRIWSIAERRELRGMGAHPGSAFCVAWSPDGKTLASGGIDGAVKLWKEADGSLLATAAGHEEAVFCLAFALDGKTLFSGGGDRTVRKWSVPEGKPLGAFPLHGAWVSALRLLPDGARGVSSDYDGVVVLWDASTGAALSRRALTCPVHSLAPSPDGKDVTAAGADGSVYTFPLVP